MHTVSKVATGRRRLVVAGGLEAGVLLVAWLLAGLWGISLWRQVTFSWAAVLWGAALTVPPAGFMWIAVGAPWAPMRRMRDEVESLVRLLFVNASPGALALIALLAGVSEEALFRGVIQTGLSQMATPLVGLAAASVVFGLVHLITRVYAALAGLLGLYLGVVFMVFDNLLVPIVVHAGYDFLALSYVVRLVGQTERSNGQAV